jgi:hypothetical protein
MNIFSWPIKVFRLIREYYNKNRKVKYAINIFSSLLSAFFGALLYALFLENTPLKIWSKIGILLTSTIGALSILLLVIERIFKIEVHSRQLDYTNLQIQNSEVDIENISKSVANRIASIVTNELLNEDSIFEIRSKHYRREKRLLAEKFSEMLGDRIRHLQSISRRKIQVIIDSGSTLSPLFDVIGRQASIDIMHWSKNVSFYTNNIKGVQQILKYREISCNIPEVNPANDVYDDRHLEIPVTCSILPGKILSAYSAIADESTIHAVKKLSEKQDAYTICITTGNYVLFETKDINVLPIARTSFHPHMKSILYDIADELFLVAPLGKILKGEKGDSLNDLLNTFNSDLGFDKSDPKSPQNRYLLTTKSLLTESNLQFDIEGRDHTWGKKTILVTTAREKNKHNFFEHYNRIKYNVRKEFFPSETVIIKDNPNGPYLWTCLFDQLPKVYQEQNEEEIPHANLRPYRQKYFWVDE